MNKVKVTLPGLEIPVTGKQVIFEAPCNCSSVECIQINGVDYSVVNALGDKVTGIRGGGTWVRGAHVSVILDCENKKAYLQGGGTSGIGTGENLLHNWYFADPINSRGETMYTYGAYSIDRWKNNYHNNIVTIVDGYVQWHWSREEGTGESWFHQQLDSRLIPGVYTLSALVCAIGDGAAMYLGNGGTSIDGKVVKLDVGLISKTYTITEEMDANRVQFKIPENSMVGLVAVKLERGSKQTLATQNDAGEWELLDRPNEAIELLKCISSKADPDDEYANK